jgi:drug/metabolite transporter (DMT)-like permease
MQTQWRTVHIFHTGEGEKFPEVTTNSVIGITVAICGNILISLALNFQKLAHKRRDRWKALKARERELETRKNIAADAIRAPDVEEGAPQETTPTEPLAPQISSSANVFVVETAPLLRQSHTEPLPTGYGTSNNVQPSKRKLVSRLFPSPAGRENVSSLEGVREDSESSDTTHTLLLVDGMVSSPVEDSDRLQNGKTTSGKEDGESMIDGWNEGDYLKSKLWWLGFLLMNIGECGNFISYAFAPASVVAPLGTFALVANCVFAPLLLKERFRKLDLFGILIATFGAVTVVLSSNTSDVRLDPAGLLRAISQRAFIIFSCIYIVAAIALASLSEGKTGKRVVFVDVGLCAIFGGFTVLSTKGISTLLTLEWIDMFTEWITYPVILVLILTGIGQIRYLNRALQRFDSKVVIPIQFVFFTLSAIIGSAVLYGDFKNMQFHQCVTFLYGCLATFLGVFIIAWAPSSNQHLDLDFEGEGEDERAEEGAGEGASDELERGIHAASGSATGSIGRRKALVLSPGGTPVLRRKHSSVGLIGLSPAQVHGLARLVS